MEGAYFRNFTVAEFLTYSSKKCKKSQKILFDGCYLLFEEYLLDKKSVCILKPSREIGQSF